MKIHILENNTTKCWQGYVGVPKGHPLFGKDYRDSIPQGLTVDPKLVQTEDELIENKGVFQLLFSAMEDGYSPISYEFNVHGGITYSGYSYWTRFPVVLEQDLITAKFLKLKRLTSRCGNDLFSHWYRKNETLDPTEGPALRIKNFWEATKNITLPHLTSEDGFTSRNFSTNGIDVAMGEDDYWWFGWDSNHFGDTPYEFTETRAFEETKRLKDQFEIWTKKYFK